MGNCLSLITVFSRECSFLVCVLLSQWGNDPVLSKVRHLCPCLTFKDSAWAASVGFSIITLHVCTYVALPPSADFDPLLSLHAIIDISSSMLFSTALSFTYTRSHSNVACITIRPHVLIWLPHPACCVKAHINSTGFLIWFQYDSNQDKHEDRISCVPFLYVYCHQVFMTLVL